MTYLTDQSLSQLLDQSGNFLFDHESRRRSASWGDLPHLVYAELAPNGNFTDPLAPTTAEVSPSTGNEVDGI